MEMARGSVWADGLPPCVRTYALDWSEFSEAFGKCQNGYAIPGWHANVSLDMGVAKWFLALGTSLWPRAWYYIHYGLCSYYPSCVRFTTSSFRLTRFGLIFRALLSPPLPVPSVPHVPASSAHLNTPLETWSLQCEMVCQTGLLRFCSAGNWSPPVLQNAMRFLLLAMLRAPSLGICLIPANGPVFFRTVRFVLGL